MRLRGKLTAALAVVALMAGFLVVGAPSVDAATTTVECSGDDSVLQGTLGGVPFDGPTGTGSQGILNLLGQLSDPPTYPPDVTIESGVRTRIRPASVPPGESTIDFFNSVELGQELLDTAAEAGIESIDLSNIEFELAPGPGVSGSNLVGNPSDTSVDLTGPLPDLEQGPFPGTFNVTADIGDKVRWDLVRAQIGASMTVEGFGDVTIGLSCAPTGDATAVEAFVLPPPDPNGPVVPDVERTTPEDTPVEIDLLAGVEEGPVAPTDPASLAITADPSNGSASLSDGTVTYTPDSGFTGDDQFIYTVCTESYLQEEGQNQITELTVAGAGQYTLTVDGEETAPINADADPADVETALEALSTVGEGNVAVSGGPGDQTGSNPYSIEFTEGLAQTEVDVAVGETGQFDGEVTVSTTQDAVPEEIGVSCNNGVVTITVTPEEVPTTTTPAVPVTPTPTPQPVQPAITG